MPVWKKAMDVAEKIYTCTEQLPRKENYGFTSQIRRSALSISANIAEAYGRQHRLDKNNFYYWSHLQDHLQIKLLRHFTFHNDNNKIVLPLRAELRTLVFRAFASG